jgi:Tfp pilus assembly protein PilO
VSLDANRLRPFAPILLPLLIVGAGWTLLIRPTGAQIARDAQQVEALQQRLALVRTAMMEPPPPESNLDPVQSFERQLPARDSTHLVMQELTRLAPPARFFNLQIATGESSIASAARGPRVGTVENVDPRFTLFDAPLVYSPLTMSFETDYASLGDLLWRLRDLATIVEIRSLEITPGAPAGPDRPARARDTVHAALTLFAYARTPGVAQTSGATP